MSKRPIRVLSVAHTAVESASGRMRYRPFADRADLDVHLVAPQRWYQFGRAITADPPADEGVTMNILPIWFGRGGPASWYLHVYPGLPQLVRRLRPDVIHLWEEPWSFVALQSSLLKGEAALVLEVDQNILKRLPPPFEQIRRHVLRRTDHVLSRNPDATDVVRACGYDGPVTEIGYGVDTKTFFPKAAVEPKGSLRLGYVGRLVVEKGIDDALDALALTAPDVTLAIVGEGPHERELRRKIETLGLGDRVSIGGWRSPNEVADFIRSLDALLLLTRTTNAVKEQFGRVIIEAQSCGVPVIGSTCGAIAAVTADGGWIVPESDPPALAALIEKLRADPALLGTVAAAGLRNIQRRFTHEAVAGQLADAWISASSTGLAEQKQV
ncbi:glycosyltransferase family 4 protein [Tianweitania sediminis]|uniref:Glycosyltransferase family 4 protein n=1 Tax=Tianweitania sediminis TaxID=1502156 RepID=A0A8J7UKF2_9HYPH|nr:glycosyltransferase family 4 protein [Tianweitania sediminis]MBP0439619.1 glycosyltransferase family 4 protein [Tianweitania sediminis]